MLQNLPRDAEAAPVQPRRHTFGFDAILARPNFQRFRAWYDRACRLPKLPAWPTVSTDRA
jgi:hypothetical protein